VVTASLNLTLLANANYRTTLKPVTASVPLRLCDDTYRPAHEQGVVPPTDPCSHPGESPMTAVGPIAP
jgi:hypothetical protein